MDTLRHDLRYALRMMRKSPGFTAVALLTLGLGIGACTAIFSVVYGVLLAPLPYPDPEQIMQVWQVGPKGGRMSTSDPNFEEWREQNRSFQALAQYAWGATTITGGSEPVRASGARVSRGFFAALGVQPVIGRAFLDEELSEGAAPAVVVSHGFWQRFLGDDPDLSKHKLTIFDQVHSVTGVMPQGFSFPPGADLWTPREQFRRLPSRTAHNWQVIGRLKDGIPLAQAQQEMSAIGKRQMETYGDDIYISDIHLVSLHEHLTLRVQTPLYVLLAAVGFLLLVACANVTNLLLAQAATRQRELAVRAAMGAGRGRLVRQFLAEALILALAGGALGLLVAVWGVDALVALDPGNLPRVAEIRLNSQVLAFAFGICVVVAAGIGLVTALRSTRLNLQTALKESQRTQGGGGNRARTVLAVSQVAVTLVLLVGVGLLARSFLSLLSIDPGFRTQGGVVMDLARSFPRGDQEAARLSVFHDRLIDRLRGIPGVEAAGGINVPPLGGSGADGTFIILSREDEVLNFEDFGRLMKDPARTGYAEFRVASDDYFRAMNIPLVRGRMFDARDGIDAPHAALISESLARTRWPDQDPIGKLIQFGNMDGNMRVYTIVGIVGDVRDRRVDIEPASTFYGNSRQRPRVTGNFSLVMTGPADTASITTAARNILAEMAPDVPPRFRTLEQVYSSSLADRRFVLTLMGVFGATALAIALLGVYGVTSYGVTQRTQEIGIRMALGAQRGDVLKLVLRQAGLFVLLGIGIGLAGAWGLTRFLGSLLYGVEVRDLTTFVTVAALMAAMALVACAVPARRATKVDPIVALRYE